MIDLAKLLAEGAPADVIAKALDAGAPEERLTALRALGRKEQRKLYQAASRTLPLEHLVPLEKPARAPVRHFGKNTLPLPGKHKLFEKRFCRPDPSPGKNGARLFGYNEAPSRGLVGPGYFVALPTQGNAAWEERGGIVVDYFQVPDSAVAEGWPQVVPNSKGLQRFVYDGTRDFLRGVSRDVCIGAAYKGEKALDHYFTLCREA